VHFYRSGKFSLMRRFYWIFCLCLEATSSAQDFAPERVSNMTYQKNPTSGIINPSVSVLLSNNGIVYRLSSPVNGVVGPVLVLNRYTWRKTGAGSGTFTLGDVDQSETFVVFTAANVGTYRDQFGSGSITFTPFPLNSSAPLSNLSTRLTLAPGQTATVGFVVVGFMPRRVLVRVIGPSLAQFGVSNAATNPVLTVFRNATQRGANSGWGGPASVAAVFSAVGAFALPAASRDSALVLTLEAGDYTAQARADSGGEVLVEVYFVD
jgi:hypothetical protein